MNLELGRLSGEGEAVTVSAREQLIVSKIAIISPSLRSCFVKNSWD